jgi:hypothetical protein
MYNKCMRERERFTLHQKSPTLGDGRMKLFDFSLSDLRLPFLLLLSVTRKNKSVPIYFVNLLALHTEYSN